MKKRILASLLLLSLLLGLCACGKGDEEATVIISGTEGEMTEEWIPSRIDCPDWLARATGWETEGDTIWLSGVTPERTPVIAAYDTLSGTWTRVDFTTGDAWQPEMGPVSLAGDSIWVLLHESNRLEDYNKGTARENLDYYVLHIDRRSGASTATRVPFEGESSTEGSGRFFSGLLALDDERAILAAMDRFYVIDAEVNVLDQPNLPAYGNFQSFRVNDRRWYSTPDGSQPLDRETLSFGAAITFDEGMPLDSNNGHFLLSVGKKLYSVDPESGERELLFNWVDVALSLREIGGFDGFENSQGDVYYPNGEMMLTPSLVRVTKGLRPARQTLRLGAFSESGNAVTSEGYALTAEMMDAVIRFNNTDPAYRIEIVPIPCASEQERDRVLIELATRTDLDLLDTSFLPDKALDSGLLADLLPMIDADESISREDFIEPLLQLMIQHGGLYEYTAKFTLLTMTTHPDLFPGRENWTVENIEALIKAHPEMDPLWHSIDRELITTLLIWAATAEFIDRDAGTCSFDSPAFVHWLELLKALPNGSEYSEDPKLMNICYDLAFNAGHQEKYMMKGDYVVAGFPETEGTGSYFLKLGSSPNEWRSTIGANTRVGIMAASANKEGAWRFVRTLMEGSDIIGLENGIPVFKADFERAVNAQISDDFDERFQISYFTAEDAEELRQQVYGTTKLVIQDEALIRMLREEIDRYLAEQISAEEAAAAIQNRARIYVSEQYG